MERLGEVCQMGFNSTPVVNMAGKIIGLIPTNFIIILVENHAWYEHELVGRDSREVTSFYKTHTLRQESLSLSAKSPANKERLNDSPHGSPTLPFFSAEQEDHHLRGEGQGGEIEEEGSRSGKENSNKADYEPKMNKVEEADKEETYRFTGASELEKTLGAATLEERRTGTMKEFTGEKDLDNAPPTKNVLPWWMFNSDLYSSDRKYEEVADIFEMFGHKKVDLRPYMIEEPYVVQTTDKLPKCLDLFRHMHLRALPVLDPNSGVTVAVLTRQDIFAYMAL